MFTQSKQDHYAFILKEWRERIRQVRENLPLLFPGYMEMKKAGEITKQDKQTMKSFIQLWQDGKLNEVGKFTRMEIMRIHVRLQFCADLITSYMVQLALNSPEDYSGEIRMSETSLEQSFWDTCKMLMLDVWDKRGAEWILAACVEPNSANHDLAEVFQPELMENLVNPKIEEMVATWGFEPMASPSSCGSQEAAENGSPE